VSYYNKRLHNGTAYESKLRGIQNELYSGIGWIVENLSFSHSKADLFMWNSDIKVLVWEEVKSTSDVEFRFNTKDLVEQRDRLLELSKKDPAYYWVYFVGSVGWVYFPLYKCVGKKISYKDGYYFDTNYPKTISLYIDNINDYVDNIDTYRSQIESGTLLGVVENQSKKV